MNSDPWTRAKYSVCTTPRSSRNREAWKGMTSSVTAYRNTDQYSVKIGQS